MGFFKWMKQGVIESFFRNREMGNPHRNSIGLLLGFVTALILLASYKGPDERTISEYTAAWIFSLALLLIIGVLIFTRPYKARRPDLFAWGFFAMIVLGFGLGALAFHYRLQITWLWEQYLLINTASRVILEALFLLGVILGFFVVRNWAKEQKDFVSSLTAVLGGAFVASIVGKLDGGPTLTDSFAAYALGFTLSGTLNLIIAARLTAAYTNRRTIASRAMLDFLYGSERATIIDGYFLKNFKEDPDYAKARLVETLIEFTRFAKQRFAERMEGRRKERINRRARQLKQPCFQELEHLDKALAAENVRLQAAADAQKPAIQAEIDQLNNQRQAIEDTLRELQKVDDQIVNAREQLRAAVVATEAERTAVQAEADNLETILLALAQNDQQRIEIERQLDEAKARLQEAVAANAEAPEVSLEIIQLETLRLKLQERLKTLCRTEAQADDNQCGKGERYYRVLAIEGEVKIDPPPTSEADRQYTVLYHAVDRITADMFRLGVSVRWQDTLEYILTPGQYKSAFPVMGSVAGLALLTRQTIVMNRDRYKKFRSKDYGQGIAPDKIEQQRGLDEIDFLSYVSIPVVSRLGSSTENGVGILSVDTRLFLASDAEMAKDRQEREPGIFSATLVRKDLVAYASRLYEQNDKDIKYLEEITEIVVPVLELYLKCRVGAT